MLHVDHRVRQLWPDWGLCYSFQIVMVVLILTTCFWNKQLSLYPTISWFGPPRIPSTLISYYILVWTPKGPLNSHILLYPGLASKGPLNSYILLYPSLDSRGSPNLSYPTISWFGLPRIPSPLISYYILLITLYVFCFGLPMIPSPLIYY